MTTRPAWSPTEAPGHLPNPHPHPRSGVSPSSQATRRAPSLAPLPGVCRSEPRKLLGAAYLSAFIKWNKLFLNTGVAHSLREEIKMNPDNGKLHGGTADSPEINTTSLRQRAGERQRSRRLCRERGTPRSRRGALSQAWVSLQKKTPHPGPGTGGAGEPQAGPARPARPACMLWGCNGLPGAPLPLSTLTP